MDATVLFLSIEVAIGIQSCFCMRYEEGFYSSSQRFRSVHGHLNRREREHFRDRPIRAQGMHYVWQQWLLDTDRDEH